MPTYRVNLVTTRHHAVLIEAASPAVARAKAREGEGVHINEPHTILIDVDGNVPVDEEPDTMVHCERIVFMHRGHKTYERWRSDFRSVLCMDTEKNDRGTMSTLIRWLMPTMQHMTKATEKDDPIRGQAMRGLLHQCHGAAMQDDYTSARRAVAAFCKLGRVDEVPD